MLTDLITDCISAIHWPRCIVVTLLSSDLRLLVCLIFPDPHLILVLQEFLKKEFSEENILFWQACEFFSHVPENDKKQVTDTVWSHTSIHLKPSSNNKRTFYVLISSLNSSSSLSLSLITLSFHLYLHLSSTLHPCPLLPLILPDPPTFPSSLSVPGRSTTASCPVKPQHQST